MGSNTVLELASRGDGARVVDAGSAVKGGDIAPAGLVDAVGETVTVVGTSSTLADHLVDGSRRARVLDIAIVVAGAGAVVVLHQTGVANTIVGGLNTDTAARLLHDDSQDEAVVNTSGGSSLLDAVPDGALYHLWLAMIECLIQLGETHNFRAAVVGLTEPSARVKHGVLVVVKPGHIVNIISQQS